MCYLCNALAASLLAVYVWLPSIPVTPLVGDSVKPTEGVNVTIMPACGVEKARVIGSRCKRKK